MSANPQHKWTSIEYLEFERSSNDKHELIGGETLEISSTNAKHNNISGNTIASLHSQLRNRDCLVFPSDTRVTAREIEFYAYPDLSIVCGEPHYEDDELDTLLNPTIIIEVLSPSTEGYDRGKKFSKYRAITSLREYVLIAQDSIHIEHLVRQENDSKWLFSESSNIGDTITLSSIDSALALADVYEKVNVTD